MKEFMFLKYINSIQKPIIINGTNTGYIVDIFGYVYNKTGEGNSRVTTSIGSHGYELVTLHYEDKSEQYLVHRIVADTFCSGRTEKRKYVNHIDGDKTNNRSDNLEWVSGSENMIHAVKTGLHPANNPVYTDDQIHRICKLLEEGEKSSKQISEIVGVNYTLICDIKFRGKHKRISSRYNLNTTPVGHKQLRDEIFCLMNKGYSNSEIFDMIDISEESKRHIEYCRYLFNKKNNKKSNGRYKRVDRCSNK